MNSDNQHPKKSISSALVVGRGPQLLLLSLAGAGTAAGLSLTRWLLTETGEILLLSSNINSGNEEKHEYYDCEGEEGTEQASFGEEIPSSCFPPSSIKIIIGKTLISISSSPQIRCLPLFLILLSSTTFLIGIILTHKQLMRFYAVFSHFYCQNEADPKKIRIVIMTAIVKTIFGEEVADEIEVYQPSSLRQLVRHLMLSLRKQPNNSVLAKLDNLVMDEYVQKFIQHGVEMVLSVCGGIVLYSLPENLFSPPPPPFSTSSCSGNNNGAAAAAGDCNRNNNYNSAMVRRRIIHAANPWLERVLFCPGGMWDVLPNGWRDYLVIGQEDGDATNVDRDKQRKQQRLKIEMVDGSFDNTQETLVGTEITTASIGSTDNETDDDDDEEFVSTNHHFHSSPQPSPSVVMKTRNSKGELKAQRDVTRDESVGEALYASICDVVASNLANSFQSRESSRQHEQEEKVRSKKYKQQTTTLPPSCSPQLQVKNFLHRTTIAATTIFCYQFFASPTTRRSWISAMNFLTSAGLFSTTITAGVASYLLRSSETASPMLCNSNNSAIIKTILCSKVLTPLYSSFDLDTIVSRVNVLFKRFKEEMKKNKRLQVAFAMTVLYGMKQVRRIRSGDVKSRRVR